MNEIVVVNKGADWRRLKALVLDSVSSPFTKHVYIRLGTVAGDPAAMPDAFR